MLNSSFQYINAENSDQTIAFDEFSPSIDDLQLSVQVFTDFSPSTDLFVSDIVITNDDFSPSIDNLLNNLIQALQDFAPSVDSFQQDQAFIIFDEFSPSIDSIGLSTIIIEEPSPSTDQFNLLLANSITFDDFSPSTDILLVNGIIDTLQCGVTVCVEEYDSFEAGVTNEIQIYDTGQFTTNLDVFPFNLAAVTNASSINNPFLPTVIFDGNYYVSNPSTDPGHTAGIISYIAFSCGAIGGISLSDIYSFNLTLNDLGGTFDIVSKNPPGGLGSHIPIFGLLGTITRLGRINSNSAFGYVTSGVFGSPSLNNQLIFEVSGNLNVNSLVPNQTMQQPHSSLWQTYQAAAMAIAGAANVNLAWMVQDSPLIDFYPQSGITALNALSTLAEGVGAKLRWFGNNQYVIAYPNQAFGAWSVPNCKLINAGGLRYQYLLNVENDFPLVVFPSLQQYSIQQSQVLANPSNPPVSSTNQLGGGGFTTIQNLGGTTKLLSKGSINSDGSPDGTADPAIPVPIPDDTQSVYVQVLIPYPKPLDQQYGATWNLPASDTLKTQDDIVNGLPVNEVSNRDTWFLADGLNAPGISTQTVIGADGQVTRRVLISPNFFNTANTSVNDEHFTVNIGVVRLSLDNQFKQAQQESNDQQNYVLSQQQMRYRFIPTYQGTIDAVFWGSMPLPGQIATASVGGVTVNGIIENVSFSFPANLSVQVQQYRQLNFITNFTELTANPFGQSV